MRITLLDTKPQEVGTDLLAIGVYENALGDSKTYAALDQLVEGLLTDLAGEEQGEGPDRDLPEALAPNLLLHAGDRGG